MTIPLVNRLIGLVFPQRCAFCSRVSGSELQYCHECESKLRLAGNDCKLMLGLVPLYSAFRYSGGAHSALAALKFGGRRELAGFLADEMYTLLTEQLPDAQFDVVAYLPMPEERKQHRGYNQAELLAERIAARLGIPCSDCGLYRTASFAQHDLHLSMRVKQLGAGFDMSEGSVVPLRVLLVDDLCTSGNSLRRCILLLSGAGAANIVALTAFRGER